MAEQIYMKLMDKVKRPTLTKTNISKENKSFKRLYEQYARWCLNGDMKDETEVYESELIECILHHEHDGYALAEHLKREFYIEPDSELVSILDTVSFVRDSLEADILTQWIKENFLEIPTNVLGKRVNAKQGWKTHTNNYITSLRPDRYQVTISDTPDKKGGYIINYENIVFV